VWFRDGMIAVGNAHKDKVKLTFSKRGDRTTTAVKPGLFRIARNAERTSIHIVSSHMIENPSTGRPTAPWLLSRFSIFSPPNVVHRPGGEWRGCQGRGENLAAQHGQGQVLDCDKAAVAFGKTVDFHESGRWRVCPEQRQQHNLEPPIPHESWARFWKPGEIEVGKL
jgi:hypothetical protein